MSELKTSPVSVLSERSFRYEPLFEEGSIEPNPDVPVYRKTHRLIFVLTKDEALTSEVQELCLSLVLRVKEAFSGFIVHLKHEEKKEAGKIPIDISHAIGTTTTRMVADLEAKKNPKLRKLNQIYQSRIEVLRSSSEKFRVFFEIASVFSTETTAEDLESWGRDCFKKLFRIDVDHLEQRRIKIATEEYFKALHPNKERFERYEKYVKAGFSVIEDPKIGDTVWYSGGETFLQGVVTKAGVQTGRGSKKFVHGLFDLPEKYGDEALFLRRI